MADLSLGVFGPFQGNLGTAPLPGFRTLKVQALLVYLAIEQDPHSRESLMTLLWPGLPERSARGNLRQIIYYLRKMIPEVTSRESGGNGLVPLFIANRSTIQLNPVAAIEVDAHHFESCLQSSQNHIHLDLLACRDCRYQLEKAIGLYRGDFLEDFYLDDSNEFEEWAQVWREAYRRKALDALEVLTTMSIHQKEYPKARAYAEQQLEIDDLRESAYRQVMEVMALSGQRADALMVYERCRRHLAEELGMAPAKRTTELYERILVGELSFDTFLSEGVRGYELKDEIGEGTYGTIHRAVQSNVGREVAVKVIRRKYANDPEFIRRFEAEAQTVARLEHPHIVPLYDYWRDPDGAYLVMRYLRGGNLLTALASGPWDPGPAGRLLEQIAGALSVAHGQGVVHRDIKPANILLDEASNAYLSDFGIAKDLTGEIQMTAQGAVIGTPDYISPEQILNDPITQQSDIYSLGAVLYETLTGEKPFPDSSVANLIYKHLHEPVPLVSASRPDLPAQIDLVIQRATAKRPVDRYADALEMAEAFRAAVTGIVAGPTTFDFPVRAEIAEIYNPYKGLQAFQEADADDFFGREALVDQLISRLVDSRFLAVVGPSGSGKSSAVKAGLIPALRQGALPGSEKWFLAEMAPGTHPLEELELALWPVAVDPPSSLVEPMQRDIRGMLRTIRRILPDEPKAQLLLVIDQFEELFTLVDDERREFFIDSLLVAIRAPRGPLRVIITLRADFYDRPLQAESLGRLIKENTEIVLPLTAEELSWAIREPARRVGVDLEDGLAEAIVADVTEQPGALPLMQYALTELFERRQESQLTQSAYEQIGRVPGALGRRADEIYDGLGPAGREATRQMFLRLVTLGKGVEDTRRRVLRSELESVQTSGVSDTPEVSAVIDAYGAARLLTFDHDPSTRQPSVEVAHEALLREWGRLRGWLDESRNDVRLERMMAQSTAEWLVAEREPGYLLRDARLDLFAGWAAGSTIALTGDELTFLEASITAREARLTEEEARRQRELETAQQLAEMERARAEEQTQAAGRLRQRAIFLTGALVVAGILAIAAFFFANQSNQNAEEAAAEANQRATAQAVAVEERQVAEEQRQVALEQASIGLASQSLLELSGDKPERAVLLALEALENYPYTWQAERALGQAVFAHHLEMILPHENTVNTVMWSPDQTRILTTSSDGLARLWDVADGELLHTLQLGVDGAVFAGHWSPVGDQVTLYGEEEYKVYIWNTSTGQQDLTLDGHQDLINAAAWSPSGDRILTASADQTAKIWDAVTGEELVTFNGHDEIVYACDVFGTCSESISNWSPDGNRVVTNDEAGEIFIWDPATGEELLHLSGHVDWVNMATWSPDGQRIASASDDGTARIWDANTGQEVAIYDGNHGNILGASWSPGSDRVMLNFNLEDLIIIIDADSGEELVVFDEHGQIPWAAIWSEDGSRILSGAGDGTARIWDSVTGKEENVFLGHASDIITVAWSPSEDRIVTGSEDGTAKVWRVAGLLVDLEIPGDDGGFWGYDWSPTGDLVARSFSDFQNVDGWRVKIFDTATGETKLTIQAHDRLIDNLEFSPSGHELLTGGRDGLARVWNVEDGTLLTEVTVDPGYKWTAWSTDGDQFATSKDDGGIQIWDVQTGEELLSFDEHSQPIRGIVWSPDGKRIASTSQAGEVMIWDPASGEIALDLLPEDFTLDMGIPAWSADGTRLAAYSSDGNIYIWDTATGELLQSMSGHAGFAYRLSWFPSGDRLLSADINNDIKVWDVESGSEVLSITIPDSNGAWLSPDGQQILDSVVPNGPLIIFNIWQSLDELVDLAEDCCVIRELTPEERLRFGLES
ncbi:MAG: hypothetical protein AMJ56_06610 [Anaerolineae bacterium SG8_19]|nr:MAG: hypothetical protein AMJ56_06610 [Anaerolineae bacterium SG8_19]